MQLSRVWLLIVCLMLVQSVAAQGGAYDKPGTYEASVDSGGIGRRYLLHIPTGYDPATPTPLVISYHGYMGTPEGHIQSTGLREKADASGFILVVPQGQGQPAAWFTYASAELYAYDDVQFTRDLIAHLQAELNIDPRRIYATGMSNGGGMANRIGCDLSDVVAAVAPVSANLFYRDPCQPRRPMPILAIHGQADTTTPYTGLSTLLVSIPEWIGDWVIWNSCQNFAETAIDDGMLMTYSGCRDGADVHLVSYSTMGHEWPTETAPDLIWDFFEAHPLPEEYLEEIPETTEAPIPYVPPGNHIGRLENGGLYLLHVPIGHDLTQPLPLLISYHDIGVNPLQHARMTGFSDVADQAGFIAVYPQALGEGLAFDPLAGSPDVERSLVLVEHLQTHLSIDTSRIYVVGYSLGGSMAHRVACDLSDTVAAVVMVAGAAFVDDSCAPTQPVPILGIHGQDDGLIPYVGNANLVGFIEWGEAWALRNGCVGEPTVTDSLLLWEDCDARVQLVGVEGLSHQWPPDTAALFWAWVSQYAR